MLVETKVLPKNIKTKEVRFPNQSFYTTVNIDITKFQPRREFSDEVFGFYNELYIAIKK